jgi:hypothetical protein
MVHKIAVIKFLKQEHGLISVEANLVLDHLPKLHIKARQALSLSLSLSLSLIAASSLEQIDYSIREIKSNRMSQRPSDSLHHSFNAASQDRQAFQQPVLLSQYLSQPQIGGIVTATKNIFCCVILVIICHDSDAIAEKPCNITEYSMDCQSDIALVTQQPGRQITLRCSWQNFVLRNCIRQVSCFDEYNTRCLTQQYFLVVVLLFRCLLSAILFCRIDPRAMSGSTSSIGTHARNSLVGRKDFELSI